MRALLAARLAVPRGDHPGPADLARLGHGPGGWVGATRRSLEAPLGHPKAGPLPPKTSEKKAFERWRSLVDKVPLDAFFFPFWA